MKQFDTYKRRGTDDEFRFIGYVQLLEVGSDLCLFAPSVSGFELAGNGNNRFKKTEEHTIYVTCEPDNVDCLFDLVREGAPRHTEGG